MPIIPTKASSASRQAFEAGLAHLVRLGRVSAGLAVDPNPQPVYVLSFQGADQPPPIANAKLMGCRFLAGEAPGATVVGEVNTTAAKPTVNNLRYGASAKKISQAIQDLDKLPDVASQDYSLRVLRIPEALVEGFWLKPASGGDGLIFPYFQSFDRGKPDDKPVDIDGFLGTLQPVGTPRVPDRKAVRSQVRPPKRTSSKE